jgi:uncharacterized protein (TIGR03435 family)
MAPHPAAQDLPAERFEVATIKPVDRTQKFGVGVDVYPGGRVLLSGLSLQALARTAFGHTRITNRGDAWITTELYSVEAKPPDNSGIKNFNYSLFDIDDPRLRQMLQALLVERFQLKVSRQTRTGDVFQLTRTNQPLKLSAAKIPEQEQGKPLATRGNIGYVAAGWSFLSLSMAQLATHASRYILNAPVVDMTNLTGVYDYRQAVPDQEPAYAGIEHTDSFLRMLKEVGLELKRTQGPVETLVIESAVRPSPN